MPASTFTFYQDFKEQLGKGIHDLSTHDIKVALTNTTPNTATHAVLADITQIATAGGYTGGAGGGVALAGKSYTETGGTGTFIATDLVITASGGSMNTFRYAALYNNTAASDNLIGYLDYGSSITLADTESLTLDFTTSIFTIA